MRILITSTYYAPEPCGNAPYVAGAAEYLASVGHEVALLAESLDYRRLAFCHEGFEQLEQSRVLRRSASVTGNLIEWDVSVRHSSAHHAACRFTVGDSGQAGLRPRGTRVIDSLEIRRPPYLSHGMSADLLTRINQALRAMSAGQIQRAAVVS